MIDLSVSLETLFYALDLFGTMAFAVTGAFKAIEHKSDVVGIIILATMTGIAGGTIRDILLGKFPPNSLSDPWYVIITASAGVIIFLLYSKIQKHWNLFLKFDALGLGVFTIIGATFAYHAFGLNFLAMVLAGMLTAVGGGILRDVFVNEMPIVFVKELYASASFIGVFSFYILLNLNHEFYTSAIIGMASTTILRLLAMHYNWNLPKAKEKS